MATVTQFSKVGEAQGPGGGGGGEGGVLGLAGCGREPVQGHI